MSHSPSSFTWRQQHPGKKHWSKLRQHQEWFSTGYTSIFWKVVKGCPQSEKAENHCLMGTSGLCVLSDCLLFLGHSLDAGRWTRWLLETSSRFWPKLNCGFLLIASKWMIRGKISWCKSQSFRHFCTYRNFLIWAVPLILCKYSWPCKYLCNQGLHYKRGTCGFGRWRGNNIQWKRKSGLFEVK